MTMQIDRRLLIKGALLGAGALALPGWGTALAQMMEARGFTHDVASGEPQHDSVMLWTRYVPAGGSNGRLRWEVARDAGFGRRVAEGEALASPDHDWCVKPVVGGLQPGEWYFYRFVDSEGRASSVGRTRTLPDGPLPRFNMAVFSCANLPFGFFNAYAHAAARQDVDLVVHLGDYLYEYPRGTYPAAEQTVAGRVIEPANEIVSLTDYRLRHACYRLDPDLQALHRAFPMVMMWDDHESANDSWQDGAENHQSDSEGPWAARKAAAMQAYREWLPVTEQGWTSYRIGDLVDLFRPETRLTARSRPLELGTFLAGKTDLGAALAEFRDDVWSDPARTLMGAEQEGWLADGLARSTADGVRWQVLGQQVIMGSLSMPPQVAEMLGAADAQARAYAEIGLAASRAGLPFNFDQWDGFPAARQRLLTASLNADANLVVLSGDSHNAWAFDLDLAGTPAGIEFAGHSVTSPGYESHVAVDPRQTAAVLVDHNPQLLWADTSQRGYFTIAFTPDEVSGEWNFLRSIQEKGAALSGTHRMAAAHGVRRFAA